MGCGEAKSKKDAQGKAAEMFCNLLVEHGLIEKEELPTSGGQTTGTLTEANIPPLFSNTPPSLTPLNQQNIQSLSYGAGQCLMDHFNFFDP